MKKELKVIRESLKNSLKDLQAYCDKNSESLQALNINDHGFRMSATYYLQQLCIDKMGDGIIKTIDKVYDHIPKPKKVKNVGKRKNI